eukprot:3731905-Pleurochrysis_carterae.AAC.3
MPSPHANARILAMFKRARTPATSRMIHTPVWLRVARAPASQRHVRVILRAAHGHDSSLHRELRCTCAHAPLWCTPVRGDPAPYALASPWRTHWLALGAHILLRRVPSLDHERRLTLRLRWHGSPACARAYVACARFRTTTAR